MTEKDFAELLGRCCQGDKDVTIKSAIEHMQGALFVMMPLQQDCFFSNIRNTTVVEWSRTAIILKDSERNLYRITPDENNDLTIDQDGYEAYYLLADECGLDKILNPVAVAELQRLQAESVADAISEGRESRRAEYDRLKAEFEGD